MTEKNILFQLEFLWYQIELKRLEKIKKQQDEEFEGIQKTMEKQENEIKEMIKDLEDDKRIEKEELELGYIG